MTDISSMSDDELRAAYNAARAAAALPKSPADMTDAELIAAHKKASESIAANNEYGGLPGQAKAAGQGAMAAPFDVLSGAQSLAQSINPGNIPKNVARLAIGAAPGLSNYLPTAVNEYIQRTPPDVGAWAKSQLGLKQRQDIPEKARSAYDVGNFAASAAVPFVGLEAAGARAASAGSNVASPLLKWIGNNPLKFAATEAGSTATGAGATGLSNSIYPEDRPYSELVKAGAGAVGSVLSPFGAAAYLGGRAASSQHVGGMVNKIKSMFNPEQGAADNLAAFIASRGENPAAVAAPAGGPATVGTNSQALHDVATSLARNNPQFGRELANAEQSAIGAQTGAIGQQLTGTGSATELAQAATSHINRLDNIVGRAENEARSLTSAVAPNDVATAEALNVKARGILEKALSSARQTEGQLWGKVDQSIPVPFGSTKTAYDTVKAGMLPDAKLPDIIEKTVARFSDPANTPKLQDIQNLRSELLNQARVARAGGDFNTARNLGTLAGGALDDMSAAGGPAAIAARDYSRALNDRFTRSFAGDVLGTSDTGAAAVRPQQTLDAALTGKPTEAALRLRELQTASAPIGAGPPNPAMANVQQQYIQQLGRKAIGPNDIIDPNKASNLLRDQAAILAPFPQYTGNMQAAITGAKRASELSDTATAARLPAQSVLSNAENPGAIISDALKTSNKAPIVSLDALHNIASQSPQGIAGLRATIGAHVMQDGDVAASIDRLTKPIRPGQPSLLDWAEGRGVVSPQDAAALKAQAAQVQTFATQKGAALSGADLEGKSPDMANLAARLVGSKAGSKIGSGEGSSLVMAGYGSKMAQRYLDRMGIKSQAPILEDAILGRNGRSINQLLKLYGGPAPGGQALQPPSFYMRPSAQTTAYLGALSPQRKQDYQ